MRIIGIIGWSGSGKTTLITKMIPRIVARGLEVSTIKHAHLSFQIDHRCKDSQTYRMAGASEVLVGSHNRWAMIHELRGEAEPELAALVRKLSPVDLVLVEGKGGSHSKIEVYRAAIDKPPLYPGDAAIVAIASDGPLPGAKIPVVNLDDVEAIIEIILRHACAC